MLHLMTVRSAELIVAGIPCRWALAGVGGGLLLGHWAPLDPGARGEPIEITREPVSMVLR